MKVLPYSTEELASSLSNEFTSSDIVKAKNHFSYLTRYLGSNGLKARTILIEENYISKDFLHDYASYYALCFAKYPKICKRVHFFDSDISEEELKENILKNESDNTVDFWSHYIGFIVVKPIPGKVIGYTVLKTYPDEPDYQRNFWGLREYNIHLFGNQIKICSLAFQEQDSVLAACATTAIWSMLNKAAINFDTVLKSPSQITKDAGNVSFDGSRLFPNRGLNVLQICQAIFNSGLVSEVKQANTNVIYQNQPVAVLSNQYLKRIINAYSPIGIPIILVIKVPTESGHGLHAITVSGFKRNPSLSIKPTKKLLPNFISENINCFYAHDDQWGPFARITPRGEYELETPWNESQKPKSVSLVTHVIVPVYPKIRIAYEDIEAIVLGLDRVLRLFFAKRIKKIKADMVWDINIDFSEHFKSILKSSSVDDLQKIKVLSTSMPKYLWIAQCYIGETLIFCFTFDATNVSNAMLGVNVISYVDTDIKLTLIDFLKLNADVLQKLFKHMTSVIFWINELS